MATVDTNLTQLVINELTKAQYEALTPEANQLYLTPDTTDQDIANAISVHNTATTAHTDIRNEISSILPSQTGNSGKFLTTNGSAVSWATIPATQTVGDGAMVIQKNGTAVGTFTANQTSASTINISVPTSASDIGALPDSTTIGSANLVIQRNSTAIGTFSANATSASTINISVPTTPSDIGAQTVLVSGTNIKTINGTSILGSGDITVVTSTTWGSITGTLSNQTDLQTVLNSKTGVTIRDWSV